METQLLPSAVQVYVRWRPLSAIESNARELTRESKQESKWSIFVSGTQSNRAQTWKSGNSFTEIFAETSLNHQVYEHVVAPRLLQVMNGATCNFFAYGHSGSGKTHTIIGYDYEHEQHLGLYLAAAKDLFREIAEAESGEASEKVQRLGIAVRLYEVRGKHAYDLFNNTECHVREGPDGETHIRGPTEMLEGGKVRVRPIVAKPCWSFDQVRAAVLAGLKTRAIGISTVHDQSSRTHAILELEVINEALLEAREGVILRESELVPVGKKATDIYIEETMKTLVKNSEGQYVPNPGSKLNQERIDSAEEEKKQCEARLKAAEEAVTDCFRTSKRASLGGKLVFVDLAGSEYFNQDTKFAEGQSVQEQQQGRQINKDLFALKEVIRARASGQARIPYRSSPLTMILRSHFSAGKTGESAMILTVSPSGAQYLPTVNTLKYGNLVGNAGEATR